eukprot:3758457-Rhodomonas_salina.1
MSRNRTGPPQWHSTGPPQSTGSLSILQASMPSARIREFTGIPSGFRLRGSGHGVAIRVLGFQFRDSGFQLRTGGLALAINGGSGEGRYFLAGPPAWEPSGRLPSDDDDGSFTLIEPTCHKQRANADSTKSEHFGA